MTDESTKILQDILRWIKFQNLPALKNILTETLVTNEDKLVYEYTDGETSSRKIESLTGVGYKVVQTRWNKWSKMGIVEKIEGGQTKFRKLISLEEIGIDVPQSNNNVLKSNIATDELLGKGLQS